MVYSLEVVTLCSVQQELHQVLSAYYVVMVHWSGFLLSRLWQALISTHGVTMVVSWWLSHKEAPLHISSKSNSHLFKCSSRTEKKGFDFNSELRTYIIQLVLTVSNINLRLLCDRKACILNLQTCEHLGSEARKWNLPQRMCSLISRSRLCRH